MGTPLITSVIAIGSLAFPVIAQAGFDFWAVVSQSTRIAELYVRNRGIGGMYGPGVQTGTKLNAMEMTYAGSPALFAVQDLGDGTLVVDLENRFTDPLNKSWFRVGTNTIYVYGNPGLDQGSQWASISQFKVSAIAMSPQTITSEAGYRFARLVIPSGNVTRLNGRVGGEVGPAINFENTPFFGVSDGIYFDQLSYDVTLSPAIASGTELITGTINGYGAWQPSVVSSDNLPSFLSIEYAFSNGQTSFEIKANRTLTAADLGVYVSQLNAANPLGGGGRVNFTVQILPEPTTLLLAASCLATSALRRRPAGS